MAKSIAEYKKWKYIYENGKFDLTYPNDIVKPKSFCKYYALNKNSVDALTNMYLYATHPNQFSDLCDCNTYLLDFSEADEETLSTLYSHPIYEQFLAVYGNLETLRRMTAENYKIILYRHLGIVSLSCDTKASQLWNYYTNNAGFCIEFDTNEFYFTHYGPFPVQYEEKIKQVKVYKNLAAVTFLQANVKRKEFDIEHEWRMLVSNPEGLDFKMYDKFGEKDKTFNLGGEYNRKMHYPSTAVKSVILAERFLMNKNIRIISISTDEEEILVLKKEKLRIAVLDFLSKMHFTTYIRCLKSIEDDFSFLRVKIKKLNHQQYRIIHIN